MALKKQHKHWSYSFLQRVSCLQERRQPRRAIKALALATQAITSSAAMGWIEWLSFCQAFRRCQKTLRQWWETTVSTSEAATNNSSISSSSNQQQQQPTNHRSSISNQQQQQPTTEAAAPLYSFVYRWIAEERPWTTATKITNSTRMSFSYRLFNHLSSITLVGLWDLRDGSIRNWSYSSLLGG